MELVDGEMLADRLERGPLPVEAALKTAVEIADALDKAYHVGIVHRASRQTARRSSPSGT